MTTANTNATTDQGCASTQNTTECPRCGLVAEGIRCPRCNALKVQGCDGACTSCLLGRKA